MTEQAQQGEKIHVGDAVTYVDENGRPHAALVTAAWSTTCANLVLVSPDENQQDIYGRQIRRETSQVHRDCQAAPGRYWYKEGGPKA